MINQEGIINNKPTTTEAVVRELYEDFDEGANFQEGNTIKTGFFNPWRRDELLEEMNKETFNFSELSENVQKELWTMMLNVDTSYSSDYENIYPPKILEEFLNKYLDFSKPEHTGYVLYVLSEFEKSLFYNAQATYFESAHVKGLTLKPLDDWGKGFLNEMKSKLDSNSNLLLSEYIDKLLQDNDMLRKRFSNDKELSKKNKKISALLQTDFPTFSEEDFRLYKSALLSVYNHDDLKNVVQEKIGISLDSLDSKEQLTLASFLINLKHYQASDIESFSKAYGAAGLKVFLSIGYGGQDIGQKILDLGSQLPQETATKIFSKYAEIIDSVEKVLDVAQNNFKTAINANPKLLQSVEQSLYKRGADLLVQFHENINQNPEEIIAELERINADTITTLSIFKYAIKFGNKLPLEDISGSEFSKKNGKELLPEELSEITAMMKDNWKYFKDQEFVQSEVIGGFVNSVVGPESEKQEVNIYRKDGVIEACCRFAQIAPGIKYFGSFNVRKESQGFSLGDMFLESVIAKVAEKNILHAYCDPFLPENMKYLELGFIATGLTEHQPPGFELWWSNDKNELIRSKQIDKEKLVISYLENKIPEGLIILKAKQLNELHTSIPQGKCLTRCFRDPLHTGDWYAVYETVPSDYIKPKDAN